MPAFMSIGEDNGGSESPLVSPRVSPGEIRGDASGLCHKDWIKITSLGVDLADEKRLEEWRRRMGKAKKSVKAPSPTKTGAVQPGKAGQAGTEQGKETSKEKEKKEKEKQKEKEEKPPHTLSITKPTDAASMRIIDWAKSHVMHDVQIDCCRLDEDMPFLCMVFLGVVPTKASIDDSLKDSIELTWKRAVVSTVEFDENNQAHYSTWAEFGEEEATGTTDAAQRGLAAYVPPAPDTNEGAGRGRASALMDAALSGGLPPVAQESQVYSQERRTLSMEKVGGIEFELESFRGEERLSALFVYDVELRCEQTKLEPADVIGQEVSFRIEDQEGREDNQREPRYLSGIITHFLASEMASDRRRRYHATVVPTVWRLTQRSDCRVFQDVTVKDVVERVFSDAGFSDYDMQSVTRTHPTLKYCVQYSESDFAFVSRMLEEHGIFYYFRHEDGKHTMVLCDGPTGYVRCPEDPLLFAWDVYREPRVTSWRQHYSFFPGKFDSRDWNFTTPREPIKGQSSSSFEVPGITDVEVFEYPGAYEDADQATSVAELRIQEREAGHHFVHAVGCYDSLAPGMTIAVKNLPGEDPEGSAAEKRYLITGIRYHAEQLPEYGVGTVGYRNVLTCIPEEVTFVPPRVTPKPRIFGPQTALVVGDKETDEGLVDTDKYGRVKVQFHWDRKGNKDKDSSCWIRVAQAFAGGGFGAMALPRIGWEVVVSFLEGDPDRPLITGVVYNELHMPYHELPGAKHKTVWMTRSFPDGGKENFNELTFHDEKDKEAIYFHAERDFKRVVEHDDVLEVGEKETGGQTITIEGDQTLTINKGNRTKSIKEGNETITVKGDRSVTIESGNEGLKVSSGNQSVDVSAGKSELKAGQAIELKVGANSVKIDASGITLTVGGSSVKVDNTGVTIKGMMVKGEATMMAELKGMMVTISADAMLQTKGGITMMQ